MYRQCDMQQGNTVVRGWLPEKQVGEGVSVKITGLDGLWDVTRVYGFALEDLGLKQMSESFLKTR